MGDGGNVLIAQTFLVVATVSPLTAVVVNLNVCVPASGAQGTASPTNHGSTTSIDKNKVLSMDRWTAKKLPELWKLMNRKFTPFQSVDRCIVFAFSKLWLFVVKHRRGIAVSALLLIVIRLAVPCPIRGNWVGQLTGHLCEDHAFLRFADGQVMYLHGGLKPELMGAYRKIGWNTYIWRSSDNDPFPAVLHVGWFFIRFHYKGVETSLDKTEWLYRDTHFFEAREMVWRSETNSPHILPKPNDLK